MNVTTNSIYDMCINIYIWLQKGQQESYIFNDYFKDVLHMKLLTSSCKVIWS